MKFGLFLTPGASRAAYQVGAIQTLVHEGGIKFDVVAACSVGALNGAFTAMGQVNKLAEIWSQWRTKDVMVTDWAALLKGAVLWAPNLMSNQPEQKSGIDPYIAEDKLLPDTVFRFNLANLSTGENQIMEYPGGAMPLPRAIAASVSVPVVFRPLEHNGMQLADGLTIEGCALEEVILGTGVERVFVIGVAPRAGTPGYAKNVYQILQKATDWNQYYETLTAIEQAEAVNAMIQAWQADRRAVEQAIKDLIPAGELQNDLLAEVQRLYEAAAFPYQRTAVEIIPILPENEFNVLVTDFKPEQSRRLFEQGRRDALQVLKNLD